MITFPSCKINLGLNILKKKDGGYHDLETVFYPVNIRDALEILSSKNNATPLTTSGITIDDTADNLCVKAFKLIKKDYRHLPGISIHLHKAIPIGAGLGGGSSDAAFMLQLLNKTFSLNISDSQMNGYAMALGSDCPFFLLNKPCFATGRGENLEPVEVSFSGYKIVVITPNIHVSTASAFQGIIPGLPSKSIKEIIRQPIHTWRDELKNDFEKTIFKQYPQIEKIKQDLYNGGALFASMSGSGSSVYGIFEKNTAIELEVSRHYFYKVVGLP